MKLTQKDYDNWTGSVELENKLIRANKRATKWRGLARQYRFDANMEAQRVDNWMETARLHSTNSDYYQKGRDIADLKRVGWKVLFLVTLNLLLGLVLYLQVVTSVKLRFTEQLSDYWRNRVNSEVAINNKTWWLVDESKQEEAQQIINEETLEFYKSNPFPKLK